MTVVGKTMLSLLDSTRNVLPEQLVDEKGYASIAAIAGQLPLKLSTFWGIECRLGQAQPAVDILYKIDRDAPGAQLLAGESPSNLDQMYARFPVWQTLCNFGKRWRDPFHAFHGGVRNVWLEFDTAAAPSSQAAAAIIGTPSIFFGPVPGQSIENGLDHLILNDLAQRIGAKVDTPMASALLHAIPSDAILFQVGYMLARERQDLRVCLNELDAPTIPRWLADNTWIGDTEALTQTIDTLSVLCKNLALNLSVNEQGIEDKIGIECYMDWLVDGAEQWTPLLDFIQERGLCRSDKRNGVVNFPGVSPMPINERLSEDGLLFMNLFRKIHHIKVAFVKGCLVEAKVYLAFVQPFLDTKRQTGEGIDCVSDHSSHPWLAN